MKKIQKIFELKIQIPIMINLFKKTKEIFLNKV